MTTSLKEELRSLISEIAEQDLTDDDKAFKDMGVDSMMGVEIVAAIERQYQLKLADSELEEVSTLNRAVALVERKLAAK
jgi:acyl carrier protein